MYIKELLVALAIMSIIIAGAVPNLSNMLIKTKQYETSIRIEKIKDAVASFYQTYSSILETTNDGDVLTVSGQTLYLPQATDPLEKRYQKLNARIFHVSGLIGSTGKCLGSNFPKLDFTDTDVYLDAFLNCYLLFITPQQTESITGIRYRDFYVVSAGENREIDFDGINTGDDIVAVVSGYDIEKKLYDETLKKMETIKQALENYFYVLYMSDPTRDTSIDHFLYRKTDGTIVSDLTYLDNSCTATGDSVTGDCLATIDQIAVDKDGDSLPDTSELLKSLGLKLSDFTDSWGNPIYLDNASTSVRSPESVTSSYTMRIVSKTPFGTTVEVEVRQKFE